MLLSIPPYTAMALGCGAKILKYGLFAFNLIFVIAGLICLGVGIWLIADKHAVDNFDQAMNEIKVQTPNVVSDYKGMPTSVRNIGIILAAGGAVILVISFLGCCGAVKEWRPMLVMYAIFLMIILGVEIALAIYAAVNRTAFENDIKSAMGESLKAYGGNDSSPNAVRTAWDALMNTSQCCGVDPAMDDKQRGFGGSPWTASLKQQCPLYIQAVQAAQLTPYPATCCNKDGLAKVTTTITASCGGYQSCVEASIYQDGCFAKMKDIAASKMSIIVGVGVGVGLIQLIGILFAFCLCCSIGSAGAEA